MNFSLGQRWISDTESDLGLGAIVALEGRQVTILFPASGENRVYSVQEAPVTRVAFNPGDVIRSVEEWEMRVESIEEQGDLLCYHGVRLDTEETVSLKETFLDHFIKFNKPQDRLFAGQVDRFDRYTLRYQTWQHQFNRQQSHLKGLIGQRASLIPHQLYIADEVGQRFAPRVLLSDEVGLGKTIEAGMILHQQILTGRASRVLIAVPESLQHQWLVEMLRRFNLRFSIFDEERCDEAFADSPNVFETEQLVLVSLEFITKKRRWFEQATLADWDLLVVDEAHHLTVEKDKPSTEYQRIAELSQDIPGLILLTATPDQLGHRSHFARLQLLDPDRFYDYDAFVAEESNYKEIADAANQLLQDAQLDDKAIATITELLKETDISELLKRVAAKEQEAKQELLGMLLDRHGTGRILFRNSRSGIDGYPGRKVHAHPVDMPKQYKTAMSVLGSMGGIQTAEKSALRALFPEKIFQEFEGESASWTQFDPRVNWLIEKLKELKHEKVLLICAEAQTAISLEQTLREREGIRSAVFHEGMSIIERDRAAAYFADEYDSAQVLLCSEIGSEGRNFQFSHHLVLFDLPLNPDLLEQRIGRLDRIGQQHDVNIHVPYFANTAQEVLLRWYNEALDAFETTSTTGQLLYKEFSEDLLEFIAAHNCDEEELDPLLEQVAKQNKVLRAKMEQGRDRLLELHSSGQGRAEQIVTEIEKLDDDVILPAYMINVFDIFGVNQEDKGENTIILKPTEHMLNPSFPCLKDDGMTVTFDRSTSLSQEDAQFISWDHPMVEGVMDMICDDDFGCASVALLKNNKLPVGTFFVELIYVAETSAPKSLQVGRFLPPTPIRVLMDKAGNNLAENVAFDAFNQQLSAVGRQTASKLANALQSGIHPLIAKATDLANQQLDTLQSQAQADMQTRLGEEQTRLSALKAINPNIRDEEIQVFDKQKAQLNEHISKAQVKLDAIRLIVVANQ
ncbi:RNA polymerase-associated protein RapA [Pseudoalteromonas luteoviolacea]|uniref:RNA polymerase-associated protein RapA n=1 Tax=Pseudoalteromonas luteoviolacea H33 TaxID=1365251 RepID=A0A167DVF8_9GAMM|nr:RNA polymerase-associated protein RapA [Pseudoalteromonas luteoviolacea]KZN49414.1 ATP-dependent helicase [Pseudoalteromonas luteoviolacea H33]KZN72653.1 ATP-dependent helicase [Pseudoalteromonas luteoviolacea H33-S]MBQ4876291.1 RNA polymerase-associated protein RapA [Pseudoalteromonas luteoviolacea]MBQ4906324.1 RNA polymerase-associated protein RapA [Pseudoalteromonas luteoviolacea]